MKKAAIRALTTISILAAIVILIGGGLFLALRYHFNPDPPAANYPKPVNMLEAQRQDLDYFAKLIALDQSFSPSARAEAERRIVALSQSATVLERPKLRVQLMEIAALAGNGHTHVGSSTKTLPDALPIHLEQFSDGIYVLGAQTAYSDLLGARVESVGGYPVEKAMARLAALQGGLRAWSRLRATYYASLQDLLYGTGLATDANASTWTFRLRDGSETTRVLASHKPEQGELDQSIVRWYSTEPVAGYPAGWKFPQVKNPLPLQDYANNFRRVRLSGSCIVYLQMKAIMDVDGQSFSQFRDAAESNLAAHPPCALIVDLRYSIGGDFTQVAGFGKRLPQYVSGKGRTFVLISPMTFSATIGAAAAVKEGGGDRTIILGEPMGDSLKFYSEGSTGCLPNYRVCFDYATGMNDFSLNNCTDWRICFWPGWIFPIHTRSVAPNEIITTSFAQWNSGYDPVFERAVVLAKKT